MLFRSQTLVMMVVAALVAGCVAGSAEEAAVSPSASLGDGLGGVRGIVISDELFPVVGASIMAAGQELATTDDQGRFEVGGLPPGSLVLNVTAPGYEPVDHAVEVPMEGFAEVRVPIRGIPGQAPYKITNIYDGFMVCSYAWPYGAGPFPGSPVGCPLGQRKTGTSYGVAPDWRGGVHEMAWKTQEEMIFASSLVNSCIARAAPQKSDPCPAMVWGRSPLRIVARPSDPEYAKRYAIDGKVMWPEGNHTSFVFSGYSGYLRGEFNSTFYPACVQVNRQFSIPEHWGCPFGFGYAMGIRFQIYHTTFYHEAPPEMDLFSAIPEG